MAPTDTRIAEVVKGLTIKDLRAQLRGRGMSPGGGEEELRQRLRDYMAQTGITSLLKYQQPGQESAEDDSSHLKNNYARPGGNQNLGNRISDRPSSRVLAPPGGKSQISFGDSAPSPPPPAPASKSAAAAAKHMVDASDLYSRIATMGDPPPSRGGVQDYPPTPQHAPYASAPSYAAAPAPAAPSSGPMSAVDLEGLFRGMQLKDLRGQCRARGLNPGGGLEVLRDRVKDDMKASGNYTLFPV